MQAGDEPLEHEEQPLQELPATEFVEPHAVRRRRHAHRTALYATAFAMVAILVAVIALAVANTRQVTLSWVFGSGNASLVWIILLTAILGWLLGITTAVVFRLRTRRRHDQ